MATCVKCGHPMHKPDPDSLAKASLELQRTVGGPGIAGAVGMAQAQLWTAEWFFRGVCVICAPMTTGLEAQS